MKDIIAYLEPNRDLKEITVPDTETGSGGQPSTGEKTSLKAGSIAPYIEVNNMLFTPSMITAFVLEVVGFYPEVNFTVKDGTGLFRNRSYPMDGDLVSLLIRSKNSDFKPIRQDYRIMSVSSGEQVGGATEYTIRAILDIPELHVDTIKDYPKKSTWDCLKQIAGDLGLGFSSNVESTADSMTRVCPDIPLWDFILNDLTATAYSSDDSFYVCYIDQYYYLNFVEVNQLLVNNNNLDKVTSTTWKVDYGKDDTEEKPFLSDFIFSNHQEFSATDKYIVSYGMVNNTGDISMKNGYRNYVQWYDKTDKKLAQTFIETLNESGTTSEKVILKGREGEDHTKQTKNVYMGDFFKSNVHDNYYFAKVSNYYNEEELYKINLGIGLNTINPSLTKYKIVPVQIINKDYSYRDWDKKERSEDNGKEEDYSVNRLLSDFYVAIGLSYTYDSGNKVFSTKVLLAKREFLKILGKESKDFQ